MNKYDVQQLQGALGLLGFDGVGSVDGVAGNNTLAAAREFAADPRFASYTGGLSPDTINQDQLDDVFEAVRVAVLDNPELADEAVALAQRVSSGETLSAAELTDLQTFISLNDITDPRNGNDIAIDGQAGRQTSTLAAALIEERSALTFTGGDQPLTQTQVKLVQGGLNLLLPTDSYIALSGEMDDATRAALTQAGIDTNGMTPEQILQSVQERVQGIGGRAIMAELSGSTNPNDIMSLQAGLTLNGQFTRMDGINGGHTQYEAANLPPIDDSVTITDLPPIPGTNVAQDPVTLINPDVAAVTPTPEQYEEIADAAARTALTAHGMIPPGAMADAGMSQQIVDGLAAIRESAENNDANAQIQTSVNFIATVDAGFEELQMQFINDNLAAFEQFGITDPAEALAFLRTPEGYEQLDLASDGFLRSDMQQFFNPLEASRGSIANMLTGLNAQAESYNITLPQAEIVPADLSTPTLTASLEEGEQLTPVDMGSPVTVTDLPPLPEPLNLTTSFEEGPQLAAVDMGSPVTVTDLPPLPEPLNLTASFEEGPQLAAVDMGSPVIVTDLPPLPEALNLTASLEEGEQLAPVDMGSPVIVTDLAPLPASAPAEIFNNISSPQSDTLSTADLEAYIARENLRGDAEFVENFSDITTPAAPETPDDAPIPDYAAADATFAFPVGSAGANEIAGMDLPGFEDTYGASYMIAALRELDNGEGVSVADVVALYREKSGIEGDDSALTQYLVDSGADPEMRYDTETAWLMDDALNLAHDYLRNAEPGDIHNGMNFDIQSAANDAYPGQSIFRHIAEAEGTNADNTDALVATGGNVPAEGTQPAVIATALGNEFHSSGGFVSDAPVAAPYEPIVYGNTDRPFAFADNSIADILISSANPNLPDMEALISADVAYMTEQLLLVNNNITLEDAIYALENQNLGTDTVRSIEEIRTDMMAYEEAFGIESSGQRYDLTNPADANALLTQLSAYAHRVAPADLDASFASAINKETGFTPVTADRDMSNDQVALNAATLG